MSYKSLRILNIAIAIVVITMLASVVSMAISVKTGTGLVNSSDGAYLRSSTSISSKIVAALNNNTKLTLKSLWFKSSSSTASTKKWFKVSVNGCTGYIRSDLVDNKKYNGVSGTVTSGCNYRAGAGTGMKKIGTLSKGSKITVYFKAYPSTGSDTAWYMFKRDGKFRFVSSKYIKLIDSTSSTSTSTNAGNKFANMTDKQFENYLVDQGFPSSYRTKIKNLHSKHPNWVFKRQNTGLSWSTVSSKETKNGISLINSSSPIRYRATDSNSFRPGTTTMYKSYSTSSAKVSTLKGLAEFKLLKEKWVGTKLWLYIKNSAGKKGYVQYPLYKQSYASSYKATITDDDVNIRKGAGTTNSVVGSRNKGDIIKVVLRAYDKDGALWYKFKTDSGYAYVISKYVKFDSSTSIDALKSPDANGSIACGTWIAKDGSSWFNAAPSVVKHYLDPRNFLNEERICMFEKLTYDADCHTTKVVDKVLAGTKLKTNNFTAKMFVDAGKKYNISPVFLASRAVQETGGGSSCITGKSGVYNPFNIGATSSSNPQAKAIQYAKDHGWTTRTKAVNGAAKILVESYINNKQNSIYLQKFNVMNGSTKVATHQYMTNIQAPYYESNKVISAYKKIGVDKDSLTFIIPTYTSMPSSTKLP